VWRGAIDEKGKKAFEMGLFFVKRRVCTDSIKCFWIKKMVNGVECSIFGSDL
jgi:hypothetical protein